MHVAVCGYNGSRRHHRFLMYGGRYVWFAIHLRKIFVLAWDWLQCASRASRAGSLFPSVACEMLLETLKGPRVIWSLRRSKSFLQLCVTLKLLGEQEPHSSLVGLAPSHSVISSSCTLSHCDSIDPKAFPLAKQITAQIQEMSLVVN